MRGPRRPWPRRIINGFEDDDRNYTALQLQLNRRFKNGWAWFNNVTFSEVQRSHLRWRQRRQRSGRVQQPERRLRPQHGRGPDRSDPPAASADVGFCRGSGDRSAEPRSVRRSARNRDLGSNCIENLRQFIGQPLSTINREGVRCPTTATSSPRPSATRCGPSGRQSFTLGGQLTWQSGSPWQKLVRRLQPERRRCSTTPATRASITFLEERGTRTTNPDFYLDEHVSGAWSFPLGSRFDGRIRELKSPTSPTSRNSSAPRDRTGFPLRSRRSFQQPAQTTSAGVDPLLTRSVSIG